MSHMKEISDLDHYIFPQLPLSCVRSGPGEGYPLHISVDYPPSPPLDLIFLPTFRISRIVYQLNEHVCGNLRPFARVANVDIRLLADVSSTKCSMRFQRPVALPQKSCNRQRKSIPKLKFKIQTIQTYIS